MVQNVLLETFYDGRQRIQAGADLAANDAHGGASDVPVSLANVTLREARQATRQLDGDELRQALAMPAHLERSNMVRADAERRHEGVSRSLAFFAPLRLR